MYIRVTKSQTTAHQKVYLVEGYRDENGKVKQRIIKNYGNLADLEAQDPDILEKLKKEAKDMGLNQAVLELNLKQKNGIYGPDLNHGYFYLEALYKQRFGMQRVILTADKGLNSGRNLVYLTEHGDGNIVSQKVRGGSRSFIKQILEEECYQYNEAKTFKVKSFLRERKLSDESGYDNHVQEKVVCFWSKDYDTREKIKRIELEEKLDAFMVNPSKYNDFNRFGLKKYLKLKHVNTETGEIEKIKPSLEFDRQKYERDRELDGYYALVTCELELSDAEIIEKYRGLWKIEESFKVMKSDLEGKTCASQKE